MVEVITKEIGINQISNSFKKVKDYYDLAYARDLSRRLQEASPAFDGQKFSLLLEKELEELEFSQRQELLAKSIKDCLPPIL